MIRPKNKNKLGASSEWYESLHILSIYIFTALLCIARIFSWMYPDNKKPLITKKRRPHIAFRRLPTIQHCHLMSDVFLIDFVAGLNIFHIFIDVLHTKITKFDFYVEVSIVSVFYALKIHN